MNGPVRLLCEGGAVVIQTPAPMLFLINDVVFSLDGVVMDAKGALNGVAALSLSSITRMGQELFTEHPLLPRVRPERARRLAALISAKAPTINAALFVAPKFGCAPDQVSVRFASAQFEVMADLYNMHRDGKLDAVSADRLVWRRLAA